MELTIQKVTGDLGEYFATAHLTSLGYKICRADKINFIGHSLLIQGSLKEFDCSNLDLLCQLCSKLINCQVPEMPCKDPSSPFYSFNPNPLPYLDFPNTGDDKFRHYCAIRLSYLVTLGKCDAICNIKLCPIKCYLKIDNCIHSMYNQHSNRFDRNDPIQYRQWCKTWYGHPGRIDLFGFKDNSYYCFEVKVNKSKLLKWQVIRLNWMQQQTFNSQVVHVELPRFDKNKLLELYMQSKFNEAFELLNPKLIIQDFSLSDYQEVQESIPTTEDVNVYNTIDYHWIPYKISFLRQHDSGNL